MPDKFKTDCTALTEGFTAPDVAINILKYCNYCRKNMPTTHFVAERYCSTQQIIDRAHAKAASRIINTGRSW